MIMKVLFWTSCRGTRVFLALLEHVADFLVLCPVFDLTLATAVPDSFTTVAGSSQKRGRT